MEKNWAMSWAHVDGSETYQNHDLGHMNQFLVNPDLKIKTEVKVEDTPVEQTFCLMDTEDSNNFILPDLEPPRLLHETEPVVTTSSFASNIVLRPCSVVLYDCLKYPHTISTETQQVMIKSELDIDVDEETSVLQDQSDEETSGPGVPAVDSENTMSADEGEQIPIRVSIPVSLDIEKSLPKFTLPLALIEHESSFHTLIQPASVKKCQIRKSTKRKLRTKFKAVKATNAPLNCQEMISCGETSEQPSCSSEVVGSENTAVAIIHDQVTNAAEKPDCNAILATCKICNINFRFEVDTARHFLTEHMDEVSLNQIKRVMGSVKCSENDCVTKACIEVCVSPTIDFLIRYKLIDYHRPLLHCIFCTKSARNCCQLNFHVRTCHPRFCNVCGIDFATEDLYAKHQHCLSNSQKYLKCPECSKHVKDIHEWMRHGETHLVDLHPGPLKEIGSTDCPYCITKIAAFDVVAHLRKHTVKDCLDCLNLFLVDHRTKQASPMCMSCNILKRRKTQLAFSCKRCSKVTFKSSSISVIMWHMKKRHGINFDPGNCVQDTEYVTTEINFRKYLGCMESTNKQLTLILSKHFIAPDLKNICEQFTCVLCSMMFEKLEELQKHVSVKHTFCRHCQVSFPLGLAVHQRMHLREMIQKFECSTCKRIFNQQNLLSQHNRWFHNDKCFSIESPQLITETTTMHAFSCPYCIEEFQSVIDVSEHLSQNHCEYWICDNCHYSYLPHSVQTSTKCSLCVQGAPLIPEGDIKNDISLELHCKICDIRLITFEAIKFHVDQEHSSVELKMNCPSCLPGVELRGTMTEILAHFSACAGVISISDLHSLNTECLILASVLTSPHYVRGVMYACLLCQDKYPRFDALILHWKYQHASYCTECRTEYHMGMCSIHKEEAQFKYAFNDAKFIQQSAQSLKYWCPLCTHYIDNLELHLIGAHKVRNCSSCMNKIVDAGQSSEPAVRSCCICVASSQEYKMIFSCLLCNLKFCNLNLARDHMMSAHQLAAHICDGTCDRYPAELESLTSARQHLLEHHRNMQVPVDEAIATRAAYARIGMASLIINDFCFCPFCQDVFYSITDLTWHLDSKHLFCRTCGVVFSSVDKFKKHEKDHQSGKFGLFLCNLCSAKFTSFNDCQRHVQLHSAPVALTIFKSCFTTERVYDMKVKLYQNYCPLCPSKHTTVTAARKHIFGHLVATCLSCTNQYLPSLQKPRSKLDVCSICEMDSLTIRHMYVECKNCEIKIKDFNHLCQHLNAIHKNAIYFCTCSEPFINITKLLKHVIDSKHIQNSLPIYWVLKHADMTLKSYSDSVKCLFCDSVFTSGRSHLHHLTAAHFYCRICCTLFPSWDDLQVHESDHDKGLIKFARCRGCRDVNMKQTSEWMSHLRKHHDPSSFRMHMDDMVTMAKDNDNKRKLEDSCLYCNSQVPIAMHLHLDHHRLASCSKCANKVVYLVGKGMDEPSSCPSCDALPFSPLSFPAFLEMENRPIDEYE